LAAQPMGIAAKFRKIQMLMDLAMCVTTAR